MDMFVFIQDEETDLSKALESADVVYMTRVQRERFVSVCVCAGVLCT